MMQTCCGPLYLQFKKCPVYIFRPQWFLLFCGLCCCLTALLMLRCSVGPSTEQALPEAPDFIKKALASDSLYKVNDTLLVWLGHAPDHAPLNAQYRYQIDGYEKVWKILGGQNELRLPAGHYILRIQHSFDGITWYGGEEPICFTVARPFWEGPWFAALMWAIAGGLFWYWASTRSKQTREQQEALEAEQAINYLATSLYQQDTVETIIWDVARNCIGRLQFEDCVIYLTDPERQVLVQKAAHGPKSPRQYEITAPLEIPLGKGITGSVALSRKAEIIHDTLKDPRYIVDDEMRRSEITVPIVYGEEVLGVIDCEHSQPHFFKPRHLSILSTIASLCAGKIMRARAEAEKQAAQQALFELRHRVQEAEMQVLRAQMNPHFIFNCLNSINRYIVKSDQATASLYLTRFAKLIRLILDNSNNKHIVLSQELEALRLYIEMESLRFSQKFTWEVILGPEVNADSIEVPPMIVQPFVENAIWHGLLHKTSPGRLSIQCRMPKNGLLECVIEDNGVGREQARLLKSKSATTRKSLGMRLTEDRLTLLNQHAKLNAGVQIEDLKDDGGAPAGTRVTLHIAVQ
jgi:putative methionine-R-sulfoxide reductase with GAF domain